MIDNYEIYILHNTKENKLLNSNFALIELTYNF